MRSPLLTLTLIAGLTGPVWSDTLELVRAGASAHQNGDTRAAITLYARAIAEGGLSNQEAATVYNNRGAAHTTAGEFDLAMDDYSKAVELHPQYVVAYNNRAVLHARKGEYQLAVDDYSFAIGLQPAFAHAYGNRGNAHFYLGRYDEAITDYYKALQLNTPDRERTALWLFLARALTGADGRAELKGHFTGVASTEWPAPAARMYLGELPPSEVFSQAVIPAPEDIAERKCEALFYVGMFHLLQGEEEEAKHYLEQATGLNVDHLAEHTGAGIALQLVANGSMKLNRSAAIVGRSASVAAVETRARPAGTPRDATVPVVPAKSISPAATSKVESAALPAMPSKPAPGATIAAPDAGPATAGRMRLHLVSMRSADAAERAWKTLRTRFPTELEDADLAIEPVSDARGTFYRVLASAALDAAAARARCSQLKAGHQYCRVL